MNERVKSAAGAGLTFAAFALFGWRVPRIILPDSSTPRTILTVALILLAAGAAAIVYFLIRGRQKQKASRQSDDHDIDDAFHTAQKALESARLADVKKPGLKTMPVLIVAGPGGSTKTSVVLQSGLDPELLAGEVRRGASVVPTTAAALWYAHGTIIVEAGGKLLQDEKRWGRLTRHLLPGRVAATFSGRSHAPRRVLLCFGCDELLKPGASESVPAAAQKLRTRLMELARQLGVELPVYVLFTKADRLPYFADYVRSFARDEAQQVLGATLPLDLVEDSGWASRQDQRIGQAFDALFRSLAARRRQVLSRENEPEVRSGAYEFPREFRKIAELATRFLVELSRPSPLHVEPVLRGFYFTGVRPVVVSDPGAAAAAPSMGAAAPDATMVLSVRDVAAARSPVSGTRKVPEWMFLRGLFRDVILVDETAMALTGGSTRVNLLRRSLLTAAAVVLTIVATMLTLSWVENRALAGRAEAAIAAVGAAEATGDLATLEELRGLDSLRTMVDRLDRWGGRPPAGLRWGLYAGDDMLPALRSLWFERLRELIWPRTRAHLLATLDAAPATITDPAVYRSLFDALKAHLLTSTEYLRADSVPPAFFEEELARHWWGGAASDPARDSLVRAEFAFLGRQLARRDEPFDEPSTAIEPARAALAGFQGIGPYYDAFLNMASEGRPPVGFMDAPVRGGPPVPAAYTAEGWARVQANLGRLRDFVEGDDWVLGDAARQNTGAWEAVQDSLLKMYYADYVDRWVAFLGGASVDRFAPNQARGALDRLSGGPSGGGSPLIALLELVSRNTTVDSTRVDPHFSAVHRVVPPGGAEASATAYLDALRGLAAAFARADDPELPTQVAQAADAVSGQVRAFQLGSGEVARDVAELLDRPATIARSAAEGVPRALLNEELARFCSRFRDQTAGFPFSRSSQDATLENAEMLLLPGRGLLSRAFADGPLAEFVQELGRGFQRTGPEVSTGFIASLNRAAAVRELLYEADGSYRDIDVTLQPRFPPDNSITAVEIEIGGESNEFTARNPSAYLFRWRADQNQPARLIVHRSTGSPSELVGSGRWGLVKLLGAANWAAGSNELTWSLQGGATLSARITVASSPGAARIDDLSLSCAR